MYFAFRFYKRDNEQIVWNMFEIIQLWFSFVPDNFSSVFFLAVEIFYCCCVREITEFSG